jgi:hypothetical protein
MRARELIAERSIPVGIGDTPTNPESKKATVQRNHKQQLGQVSGKQAGTAVKQAERGHDQAQRK